MKYENLVVVATFLTLFVDSSLLAQEIAIVDASADRDIEEIVVTGTKRNLSIQDTQTSVTVLTGRQIEEQGIVSLEDILLRTPNVAGGGSNSLNTASIRGVVLQGVSATTDNGFTSNVYIDGSPNSFNANQGANNLWDVAQVEVLRGPQSTVQGRNALAGAIIINTADPEYDWNFKARASAGNEDQQRYSGVVTGPLVDDQLAFRVAADYRELDFGVVNVDTGNNTRFEEALTLRGKLLFEPKAVDGLRIELIASVADTQFGEFGEVESPVPADDPAFSDFDPFGGETFGFGTRFEDSVSTRFTADINYELSEKWSLIGLGTFENTTRDTDFGPGSFNDAEDDTTTFEFRAAFDYGRLNGWVGAYYFDNTGGDDIVFVTPFAAFPFPVTTPDGALTVLFAEETSTENTAIFGELSYEISDRWSFNLGARFDQEDFANNGQQASVSADPADCAFVDDAPMVGGLPCTAIFPLSDQPPGEASFSAFLPRGAVIYDLDDLRSLSLTVARGYRAGGSFPLINMTTAETRTFDPEFVTNFELAFRSQWLDRNLTVNANLFFSDWEDQQVTIVGPSGAPFDAEILNVGASELFGLEVELDARLSSALDLFASVGVLQTEFTDFPFAVNSDTEFANLEGNEFNNAPELTFSIGGSYVFPAGFFATATAAYTSEQFSDVTNLEINENEAYTLVNLKLGYRVDNFEISLFADNLFDERFSTRRGLFTVNSLTGVPAANVPGAFFNVNDPRLVGLEVSFDY